MLNIFKHLMPKLYLSLAEGEEAKIESTENFDTKADEVFDTVDKVDASDSSSEDQESKGEKTKTDDTSGSDQNKTEKVKEVEDDASLSSEDKIAKIKEVLGDDEKALDAYIKEKGYHADPAWQKQREIIDRLKKEKEEITLSEEDKEKLDNYTKITSSREYIESSMKTQGFTQEAIDDKLREKGFDIPEETSGDDFDHVAKTLKINPSQITKETRDDITDIAKIARTMVEKVFDEKMPSTLKPIQDFIGDKSKEDSANKITDRLEGMVKDEGILDWAKDVEPEMSKYINEHPKAYQEDVLKHVTNFTRKATIERLKVGKRKEERDTKKGGLRQLHRGGKVDSILPEKTGVFDTDADAILDSVGYHE